MTYYQKPIEEIITELKTDVHAGLSDVESTARLNQYGHNRIKRTNKRNVLQVFLEQFKNMLVILLIVAAAISFFLNSNRDAIILMMVVFFNAVIGFYQDWKSENILASLKDLIIERCFVFRNGKKIEVPSDELVPGDIVSLSEGEGIPADVRLIESTGFSTNDFILTGESQPREKSHAVVIEKEVGISEQDNCVFMGTTVAKGEATGIVVATGMKTELGRIAKSSEAIDASITPLQKELNGVAKKITYITLILAAILMAVKLVMGEALNDALTFTIGVAAAMVPEGLPAQISVSLALGVSRLAKKKAIVKKLSSVEALGAATVIASDKTGTITKNEMTIIHCYLNGENHTITGTGYEPTGEILNDDNTVLNKDNLEDLKVFFLNGYLSSTGKINPPDKNHKTWYPIGDPTESAFSTLILKAGYNLEAIASDYKRLQLFPFDSVRKRISIIREHNGKRISFIKGSIESVLEVCNAHIINHEVKPLTEVEKKQLLEIATIQAAEAKRVIAIAYKDLPVQEQYTIDDAETNIVFAGFVSMIDPPHEQVKEAIATAFNAGMRVMMITGDNEITARAIANLIGMSNADGTVPEVINDQKLKSMNDEEIKQHFGARTLIFSRVSPDEKLKIISLLKERGDVVAVTGDGVNDTLSLKKADIGIAMGLKGSKVAQEAASMVLLNDDFSTIVVAIKEGRTIYNNLKKNVLANLIGNLAELTVVLLGFVAAFYQLPVAIYAVHILLIDLIGNMLPLLMLSFDPAEGDLMNKPPRKQGEMLNKKSFITIFYSGIIKGGISFTAYLLSYWYHAGEQFQHEKAVTVTMTSIIVCQFINIFSSRTSQTVLTSYFFSNRNLFIGVGSSILFMLLISYIPALNEYLHTGPLSAMDWLFVMSGAVIYLGVFELIKFINTKK
ncbi:calcium-translocating P-type ATPase, SERCA-type [soil metagenome]